MIPQGLRALGWLAVSTPEQAKDEKESLHAQETEFRAVCDQFAWQIVDILRIPGFSRRYLDIRDFAAGAAATKENIQDGWRLMEHLATGDFDVFVCRDADRFGRSQALLARIAEDILFVQDKYIYAIRGGGLISARQGGREWITMQSYRASKEIDDLVYKRAIGMQGRFERGWPAGKLPLSHRPIRNEKGKLVACEPKPELVRLWYDLVEVLCDGVAWDLVGKALYDRYGHARPNGKPYTGAELHTAVFNPIFWGHSHKNANNGKDGRRFGLWSFDEGAPMPDGAQVLRNVFPPAISGESAERLKAELRRRSQVVYGRARPDISSPFSGLLVCDGCGYRMRFSRSRDYEGYGCETNKNIRRGLLRTPCSCTHYWISIRAVRAWFDAYLKRMLELEDPLLLSNAAEPQASPEYLDALQAEIAAAERRAEGLMVQLATTPPELAATLQRLITDTAEHIRRLREQVDSVARAEQHTLSRASAATSAFRRLSNEEYLDHFWQRPAIEINQTLHALLGGNVVIVHNGVIIGVSKPPYRNMRQKSVKAISKP